MWKIYSLAVLLLIPNICYAETIQFKNMTRGVIYVWVQPHDSNDYLRPPVRVFPQKVKRVYVGKSLPIYLVARDQYGNDDFLGWYKRSENSSDKPEFIYQYKPVFETRSCERSEYDSRRRVWRTRQIIYKVRRMVPAHKYNGIEPVEKSSPTPPKEPLKSKTEKKESNSRK